MGTVRSSCRFILSLLVQVRLSSYSNTWCLNEISVVSRRSLAIATYILCGFFSSSYVFSTVLVVLLLSADFWTVRNVSGRVLVGLRYWNQVDEDGTSIFHGANMTSADLACVCRNVVLGV